VVAVTDLLRRPIRATIVREEQTEVPNVADIATHPEPCLLSTNERWLDSVGQRAGETGVERRSPSERYRGSENIGAAVRSTTGST
jgi:hypothetical protein